MSTDHKSVDPAKQLTQNDLDDLLGTNVANASKQEQQRKHQEDQEPEREIKRANSVTGDYFVQQKRQTQQPSSSSSSPPAASSSPPVLFNRNRSSTTTNNNKNSNAPLAEPLMSNAHNTTQYQTVPSPANSEVSQREPMVGVGADSGPLYAKRLMLAIVNPLSGERSAAEGLCKSLTTVLGDDRILKLSISVFRDSTPIRLKLAEGVKRVLANFDNDASLFDGSTPDKRMSVLVAGGDGTVSFIIGVLENLINDPDSGLNGIAPALMVIPMGTGNDLSNALGSGLGFTTNKLCCCCVCCPNDVEQIVKTSLAAPIIPFDRWNATIYRVENKSANALARAAAQSKLTPAKMLQQKLKMQHKTDFAANTASSGVYSREAEWTSHIKDEATPKDDEDDGLASTHPAEDVTLSALASFDFNNYFSFGLDAAIATDFDDKRKKYPSCHTYRTMNKMWYGYHGIAMAVSATPFNNGVVNVSCDDNEVSLSSSQSGCRAFVISNIPSYSGGVDLWNVDKSYRDKQTASNSGATRDVTYQPNSVSDGKLEAVSLGGFFHMGFLRAGASGDKVAQGSHITFTLGDFIGKNELRGKTLAFQVDGEPAGQFTYDPGCLVVDVKLHSRVYFHCLSGRK